MAQEDHTDNNCFVCVILSHGTLGVVCGTDGVMKIDKLVDHFAGSNCASLVGKPKVFIIQVRAKLYKPIIYVSTWRCSAATHDSLISSCFPMYIYISTNSFYKS